MSHDSDIGSSRVRTSGATCGWSGKDSPTPLTKQREEIRREGRRLIAEGRGLIVTRRLLCGAFGLTAHQFDSMLLVTACPDESASSRRSAPCGSAGSIPSIPSIPSIHSVPVFPNHVDLVIALEQFFETSNHNQNKE